VVNHGVHETCQVCTNGLQYFSSTRLRQSGRRLTDHLGSTVAITDSNGTLTSQQRYLPFGGTRTNVTTPNSPGTDFGYTGQRQLDAGMGGLMDYKARFYSPMLGRFVQPDTITPGGPQGLNRYSYVLGNPIKFDDPTGHSVDCGLGEQYCEVGKLNTTKRANDLLLSRRREADVDGLRTHWRGLPDDERSILSEGNWHEGSYDDYIQGGGVSPADTWHDPLTYIEIMVGVGGTLKAGYGLLVNYATINAEAGMLSIGSVGRYEKSGYTYFQLPDKIYNALDKIGYGDYTAAKLINRQVVANQIAQDKPAIMTLNYPGSPGGGTVMEIEMLYAAGYMEGTAGWLSVGAEKIFQPGTIIK